MPLEIPKIDDRRYQDLLDEALARIPVHNPEWTNFNRSDPGVTIIEVFAFMTESLLYRANLIPERNRLKFLQLLGVPLQSAAAATGIVNFINERGALETVVLKKGLETRAGQIPFRTDSGLDVLPIEALVYFKRPLINQDQAMLDYYRQLYASFADSDIAADFQLYEAAALDARNETGVSLSADTVDNCLWIALLGRENEDLTVVRQKIAGKILSLGVVPAVDETVQKVGEANPNANLQISDSLVFELPKLPADNKLSTDLNQRQPEYKPLDQRANVDVTVQPGIVELVLPQNPKDLELWSNLDPLEMGADNFPPALEDTKLAARIITWLRVRATSRASKIRFVWLGINAATVSQRTNVANEILPDGTGEPDQTARLTNAPVVAGSVKLFVTANNETKEYFEIDDLLAAGAEVFSPNLGLPPNAKSAANKTSEVFAVDHEAGTIRFGDGMRGRRPPVGARIIANYDFAAGAAGNVQANQINQSAVLPAGFKVANPIRTWGGTNAETVQAGEKQIPNFLQHRERLVTAADFKTIAARTPGVDIGRVEVLPNYNPELHENAPGDAPGAVTLMVIPRFDYRQPDAPLPDRYFLDQICRYLDERRLITTEIFLSAPIYKPVWISIGINVVAGFAVAETRESVKKSVQSFLQPFNTAASQPTGNAIVPAANAQTAETANGWALRKPVTVGEILAVATRVSGVLFVNRVLLAEGSSQAQEQIAMRGLELPRILGISVAIGEPISLDSLRGGVTAPPTNEPPTNGQPPRRVVPIPVVSDEC